MATRLLLCVEPDAAALAVITSTLEPYGFTIRNITNGDMAVDFARKERPSIMMVSVEPKKIGYAICNKIKRNDELKEIPLILTSSDESLEKLEQHKTFKLRANEYMRKPLDRHELMRKLNVLIGLDEIDEPSKGPTASEEIFVDADSLSSEISIDADDIVEEPASSSASLAQMSDSSPGLFSSDSSTDTDAAWKTTGGTPSEGRGLPAPTPVDAEEDLFSEGNPTRVAGPASDQEETLPPEVQSDTVSSSIPEDHTGRPLLLDVPSGLDGVVQATTPSGDDASLSFPSSEPVTTEGLTLERLLSNVSEIEGDPDLLRKAHLDVPPSPDEVNNTAAIPVAVSLANESALVELQGRYHDLEDEKRRLTTEVEELRQRLQTLPFHKEKDLISLRETINRKERDTLELRDLLDARDRQLLDQRDVLREHERTRSDLEEKLVALEKNVIYANERATTLAHDKEMAIERERGLKIRLEAVLAEQASERDEIDSLRKRLGMTEERCRLETDKVRHELEDRIAEIETGHRDEVARLKEDRETEKTVRENEFRTDLERISTGHQAELESLQKRYNEEKSSLSDAHTAELTKLRREHEKALAALRDELVTVNETQKQTHLAALELKEREHKLELSELRRAKESELLIAEDRRRREVEAIELRRTSDLEAAETRRRTELQAREEQHHANIADLERRHLAMKNDAMERQRIELDQVLSRATMMEAELAARSEDLAEMRRRVQRTESESDTVRSDLRDREGKLSQMRDRIAELESKVADLEDQVLRSYRKIRDDDKCMDKAKRALGVAMTLLDERSAPALVTRPTDESQG